MTPFLKVLHTCVTGAHDSLNALVNRRPKTTFVYEIVTALLRWTTFQSGLVAEDADIRFTNFA